MTDSPQKGKVYPTMTQMQNQFLNESQKIEFLKSFQPHDATVFGIKSRERALDPSMK